MSNSIITHKHKEAAAEFIKRKIRFAREVYAENPDDPSKRKFAEDEVEKVKSMLTMLTCCLGLSLHGYLTFGEMDTSLEPKTDEDND